jgi:flagellar hook-basal body complex protein FliE
MSTPALAAGAYQRLAQLGNATSSSSLAPGGLPGAGGGESFGNLLKDALSSVAEAGKTADAQTVAAAQGKGNLVDVVTAVTESDVALQTLVSVRDKVISAYEEIMRMPI